MSLPAVGRFSALATQDYLVDFVRRRRFSRVVIVSDLDAVGERGAIQLQAALPVPSVIMFPPCSDVREAVKLGMTGEMLTGMLRDMVWTQP
jgi:hypothetical protein